MYKLAYGTRLFGLFVATSWKYNPSSDLLGREFDNLIAALSTIPALQELDLVFVTHPCKPLSLYPLSNLRSVSLEVPLSGPQQTASAITTDLVRLLARCPTLESLRFRGTVGVDNNGYTYTRFRLTLDFLLSGVARSLKSPWPLKVLELQGVFVTSVMFRKHLHHFRCLEYLDLGKDPSGETFSESTSTLTEVCDILGEERIFLKGLAISGVYDSSFSAYLKSCRDLRHLRLYLPGPTWEASNARFFNYIQQFILPQYGGTLLELELVAPRRSGPVDRGLLQDVVRYCMGLRKLKIPLILTTWSDNSNNPTSDASPASVCFRISSAFGQSHADVLTHRKHCWNLGPGYRLWTAYRCTLRFTTARSAPNLRCIAMRLCYQGSYIRHKSSVTMLKQCLTGCVDYRNPLSSKLGRSKGREMGLW